ncbi:MAG: TIGR02757 family protein [Bacteroidetes bacterium]|nr:TIGR02757 family protein [Bacteroidota bacterium]MDA0875461.1 TIGR02757 family protein [Bacteroidota bacterium]
MGPEQVKELRSYLDPIAHRFEQVTFIEDDPVSIPHGFDDPEDQVLIGLFAALLAWGRRDIMLRKLAELCERFDYRPRRFIHDFSHGRDAPRLSGFVHRTFNAQDLSGLVLALQQVTRTRTLESVFAAGMTVEAPARDGMEALSAAILGAVPGQPVRMNRHVARPSTGSACKRICMFLRWMVRPGPVDLGCWTALSPCELLLPLDVHSGTQARAVGLLTRKANDWRAVEELTAACRLLDPADPCRYDFAFFGTGSAGETLSPPG